VAHGSCRCYSAKQSWAMMVLHCPTASLQQGRVWLSAVLRLEITLCPLHMSTHLKCAYFSLSSPCFNNILQ
jgi:hypothetical protein